ncbi:hypothetical protein KAJ38_02430 [Candidatus Pacearchaeota archaeon]|nr:hypothetical protein [Candidatus Pacearchaeota archaeon]
METRTPRLNKINDLKSQILEAEFDLEDTKKESERTRLAKKIVAKKKSLRREERRFELYNEQSERVTDIR